jgi:hypothetical protein
VEFLLIQKNAQPMTICETMVDEAGKSLLDIGTPVVFFTGSALTGSGLPFTCATCLLPGRRIPAIVAVRFWYHPYHFRRTECKLSRSIVDTWTLFARRIWTIFVRPMRATWPISVRRIWPSSGCHVSHRHASDMTVRSVPRGSFPCVGSGLPMSATWLILMRQISPSNHGHVAHSHASDLTVQSWPRGSFSCVRSHRLIVATWLVSVRRIQPSDLCHVARSCASDLCHVACSRASDPVVR